MLLSVEEIHTYYGDSYILQGISLQIPKGTTIGVLGRNGAGKTTLIRSIVGFTPPRSGRILFKGIDVTDLPTFRRERLGIGLVPQGHRLFPSLTVQEHLVVMSSAGVTNSWSLEEIFEIFPRLAEFKGRLGGTLSGGEQQMLAIARALMGSPELLLMDEPTEGLAPVLVETMSCLLDRLKEKGVSILLVEQNLAFALDCADYVYVIDKGKIVCESTCAEFRADESLQHLHLGF